MRVADVLARARACNVDRLDAQLLLAHHLGKPRSWLLAHDEHALDAATAMAVDRDLLQRAAGQPLAYLVGSKAFHGLRLQVTPAVLVPRPETELLVDWALETLSRMGRSAPRIIDLGTGSGAVALALGHALPAARIVATDVDPDALALARINAGALQLAVEFARGHWWQATVGSGFDLAVSNPPYIAEGDPHLAALAAEPRHALTAGPDGLAALREIISGTRGRLAPGGWLLLEHGWDQAAAVRQMLLAAGFAGVRTRTDLAGHERCTGGCWEPAPAGR